MLHRHSAKLPLGQREVEVNELSRKNSNQSLGFTEVVKMSIPFILTNK
jgi:hypothetical protein